MILSIDMSMAYYNENILRESDTNNQLSKCFPEKTNIKDNLNTSDIADDNDGQNTV
jgi:hypothetical protein